MARVGQNEVTPFHHSDLNQSDPPQPAGSYPLMMDTTHPEELRLGGMNKVHKLVAFTVCETTHEEWWPT